MCGTYRPDDSHPAAVTALHQGLCLRRVLKDAKSVKHESIVTFHNLRYDVFSQLANFDQTSGIKVCTVIETGCCCCCDSPAALLLLSVVQVEEVCDCSQVVPQVLHCKLPRMALTVEQMLYGVWYHSTLRTDI